MTTATATETARAAIGAILAGDPPNGAHPGDLGEFWPTYQELTEAYEVGSTSAARTVWNALCNATPGLSALIAGPRADDPRFTMSWRADDLLSAQLPKTKYAIPNFLPEGLSILAARPKIGKSWLVLSVCGAVGTGGKVLGMDVPRGKALYLALEDSPARLQSRMLMQHWPMGANVDFELSWPQLVTDDGLDRLRGRIADGGYTFVAIDTISRLTRCASKAQQEQIPAVIDALQRISMDFSLALMLVEHQRKPTAMLADVIDDVMGGTFKTGSADAILGIYRKRGEREAHLKMTGRDIDERDLLITFDGSTGTWQFTGNATEKLPAMGREILELLESKGAMGTNALAEQLGGDKGNVSTVLGELMARRLVYQDVDSSDKRKKPWVITTEGLKVLNG